MAEIMTTPKRMRAATTSFISGLVPSVNAGDSSRGRERTLSTPDLEMGSISRETDQRGVSTGATALHESETELRHKRTCGDSISLLSLSKKCGKTLSGLSLPSFPFGSSAEDTQRSDHALGYDTWIYERVDDFPKGYPNCAALLNSDVTFPIARKYGRLNKRAILHYEIRLTDMEKGLDELDRKDAANPKMRWRLGGYHGAEVEGDDGEQDEKIKEIMKTLGEYYSFLLKTVAIERLDKAARRDYTGVFNWMWTKNPFTSEKQDFIRHEDDFISLTQQGRQGHKVENMIQNLLEYKPFSYFKRCFQTEKERKKTEDPRVVHYSPFYLKVASMALAIALAVATLLIPVYLEFLIAMSRPMMAVIATIFTWVFAVLMAMMGATMKEVFVGSAAYCAVLMTFLGGLNR